MPASPMKTSPLPLAPGCVLACPGCGHRCHTAPESLARKQRWLTTALADWSARLAPIEGPAELERWHYRDRVCLHAQWQSGWRLGLRRGDAIVGIPCCPSHSARVNAAARLLATALPPAERFPLAYYLQAGAQVTLVIKRAEVPDCGWLGPELQAALAAAGVEGLWLNCHPAAGRRLCAKRGWRLLWGSPSSLDPLGLVHGPAAFQQLLPGLYVRALQAAERFLAPGPDSSVMDLYSGRGASLRRWLAQGARSVGVELDGEAVTCAGRNAPAATVLRGPCAQRLPQLRAWQRHQEGRTVLAFLNPPRTGLEPQVLSWLAGEAAVIRLAYLSCSAGTLARDLRALVAAGLGVEALRPFDFFPQTPHVEVLALLRR